MEAYHFGFIVMAIILAISIIGNMGETKVAASAPKAGDAYENIFDNRRATFLSYGTDFRKRLTVKYIVEGSSQEHEMLSDLFNNQYKRLNVIKKDSPS